MIYTFVSFLGAVNTIDILSIKIKIKNKKGFGGAFPLIKKSVKCLWGREVAEEETEACSFVTLPTIKPVLHN